MAEDDSPQEISMGSDGPGSDSADDGDLSDEDMRPPPRFIIGKKVVKRGPKKAQRDDPFEE